jgi:outer membrane receptor protein involved in Fe transport
MQAALVAALVIFSATPSNDGEVFDTLKTSVVSSSMKQAQPIERLATPVSTIFLSDIERKGFATPKDFSAEVPNFMIPDYGSSMTSSVYMRGFGSRIDNPVIGLYIDDVPVLNKNNYDFSLLDIRRMDLFRGPQGTLYGRNSLCGVMSVSTLSPEYVQGGRARVSYGSGGTMNASGSWYKGKFGVVAAFRHTDGFYTNEYDGSKCDLSNEFNIRGRYVSDLSNILHLDHSTSLSYLNGGGYPYRQLIDGELQPISYNDDCGYDRFGLTDATRLTWKLDKVTLNSVSSFQMLFDRMDLDQDFTDKSMFTLSQMQHEYAATQEVRLKFNSHPEWWDSQSGYFGFVRFNNMDAPVTFKRDGIQTLILDNANANIPSSVGQLAISDDSFLIKDDFNIWTVNQALYHESYFTFGNWLLTAGLRLDWEWNHMKYDSRATLHYAFPPIIQEYQEFTSIYAGKIRNSYWQLLPKFSVLYDTGFGLKFFGSIAKGYKSGGFNTQIFSDILQNKLMTGVMNDMGVHLDGEDENQVTVDNTKYKPETSIDYEIGLRYGLHSHSGHSLEASASFFYIDAENQQITVFPAGKSTGRMMANVGKSYSCGVESEISWSYRNFGAKAAYGYTHAEFRKYNDGNNDYKGNHIPYSPEQTLSLMADYKIVIDRGIMRYINIGVDYTGVGRIWWNESNTRSQGWYGLFGADISLDFGKFSIFARGDNLTDREYDTFYFKSVGNEFMQRGKPARFIAGINLDF